jgi:predicted RNase H-like HicB family nuclease
MLEYRAAYYRNPKSGWYMAQVLDFPGAITQGRTLNAARRMLRDGLRLLAEYLLEEGKPLPLPKPSMKDKKADVVEPIRLGIRTLSAVRS